MNFVEALRKARPRIESGWYTYICHALQVADPRNAAAHQKRILDLLDGESTYHGWVLEHHPEVYDRMCANFHAAMTAGRLAWIDHMIATEEVK